MNTFYYQEQTDYDKQTKRRSYRYYSKKKTKELALTISSAELYGTLGKKFSRKIGVLSFEKATPSLAVYTSFYSSIFYRLVGYVSCREGGYLAVVKLRKWLYVALCLLALFLCSCFWLVIHKEEFNKLDTMAKKYTPAIEYNHKKMANQIQLPGYNHITMLADTQELYMALWNPDSNPCYFKYTLLIEKEVIYQSDLIPPGEAITTQKLKSSLSEGTYALQIKIDTFDLKNMEKQLNGGEITAQLEVTKRNKQ